MAWDQAVCAAGEVRSGAGTRVQRPCALGGVVRRERKAGLVVLALAGARRFGLRDVGAEGVERVVGDEAAPDERPEGVDGFAGEAGADGFVEVGEKGGAGAGEGIENGFFARGEGFGARRSWWQTEPAMRSAR